MDFGFVRKTWESWASLSISSSGEPLRAALLINYDPTAPSRLLSIVAEQEGMKISPIELSHFIDFIKCNKLQTETFNIGPSQYMVTSIHEKWFSARCLNSTDPAGGGAIVAQTTGFLLVALYDGSIGAAARAMMAVDQFVYQLARKNL